MIKRTTGLVLLLISTLVAAQRVPVAPKTVPVKLECEYCPELQASFNELLRQHPEFRAPTENDRWFVSVRVGPLSDRITLPNGHHEFALGVQFCRMIVYPAGTVNAPEGRTVVASRIDAVTDAPRSAFGIPADVITVNEATYEWLLEVRRLINQSIYLK